MPSKQNRHASGGTGDSARPDAAASTTSTSTEWEDWYNASLLDQSPPHARNVDDRGASVRGPRWQRGAQIVTGAAATLAVFSAGMLYADLSRTSPAASVIVQPSRPAALPPSLSPSGSPSPAPARETVTVQAPTNVPVTKPVGAARGAPPVQVSIPALFIDQRLIGLRVKANRQLEVPKSYDDIGWWSTGPVPGDPGAAVIVGHVDGLSGPAVFAGLSSITKGAIIGVRRADGTTVKFAVTEVLTFAKDEFPDELVYRTKGKSALHLVTCSGTYDRATGYRDNVVVFADLVKPKTPTTKSKDAGKSNKDKDTGKSKEKSTAKSKDKDKSKDKSKDTDKSKDKDTDKSKDKAKSDGSSEASPGVDRDKSEALGGR